MYKQGIEGSEEKSVWETLADPYILMLLLIIAAWAMYRERYIEPMDKATVYAWYGVLLLSLSKGVDALFKLNSPHFVMDNIHASTDGYVIRAGNWGITKLGVVDAWGIHEEFSLEGSAVYPLSALNAVGRNPCAFVRCREVGFDSLPPEVRVAVMQGKCPPPYFLGYFTTEQELTSPDKVELAEQNREMNKRNSFLEKELKDARKLIEDRASFEERIKERKESWTQKLKNTVQPPSEV